jgi:hypothetical protein
MPVTLKRNAAPPKNHAIPDYVSGPTESGMSIKRQIIAGTNMISRGRCKITFNGTRAYTDGKNVVLPDLYDVHLYSKQQGTCLKGYANHEGSHNRYTDFPMRISKSEAAAALAPNKKLGQKVSKLYATIHNIFEDHRIERMLVEEFPGTRENLSTLRDFVIRRHHNSLLEAKGKPLPFLAAAQNALLACAEKANQYEPTGILSAIIDHYRQEHPALVPLIDNALSILPGVQTDEDVHALTEHTVKELLAIALGNKPNEEKDEQNSGNSPDKGDSGSSDDQSASQENGDQNQDGQDGDSGDGGKAGKPGANGSGGQSDEKGQDSESSSDTSGKGSGSAKDKKDQKSDDSDDGSTEGEDDQQADGAAGGTSDHDDAQDPDASAEGEDKADAKDKSDQQDKNDPADNNDSQNENSASKAGDSAEGNDDGGQSTETAGDSGSSGAPNGAGNRPAPIMSEDDLDDALDDLLEEPLSLDEIIKEIIEQNIIAGQILGQGSSGAAYNPTNGEVVARPTVQADASNRLMDPTLAGVVRSMIVSQRRTKIETRREDGTFDNNAIIPLAIGDPDFYKRKTKKVAVSAAMEILVDASGSMDHIMKTALDTAQVTCESTAAFPHLKTSVVTYTSIYDGQGKMSYVIVKEYDENIALARKRFAGAMPMIQFGGTPTGRAMMYTVDRLAMRREQKKIMVLVTDGVPDNHKEALAAQAIARSRGITTVLIEIGQHKTPHM